jgi:CheY-like chemotaxis protein
MDVLTATTGTEAIALLESTPTVATVLIDIMCRRWTDIRRGDPHQDQPAPPTHHRADAEGHERRAREMPRGGRFPLSKPVNTDQLLSALRMWLHR